MKILCDHYFCIYQENGACCLSSVYINSTGMCDQATLLDITEEDLIERKKRSLLAREEC